MLMSLVRSGEFVTLRLRKPLLRDIKRGHCWLFSDAIETPPAAPGSVALVLDKLGEKVASGIYAPGHPIPLRVCRAQPPWRLDDQWLIGQLERALALRRSSFDENTTGYRLVNGEGDGLPGLVVDRYADVAVIKLDGGAPQEFYLPLGIARWLAQRLALQCVVARPRERTAVAQVLVGEKPQKPIEFIEHGMRLSADVLVGQKTGFFLDQRDNRLLIQSLSRGRTVLNLFSFSGGFSVAAGLGGAQRVVSVDLAEPAIAEAHKHWAANSLPEEHHTGVVSDAFRYLEQAAANRDRWDLVICDPPSFAPSEASKVPALDAYRRLAQLAAKVTAPHGVLALASCSSHVSSHEFETLALDALGRARRRAKLLVQRGLPIDHPTPLAMPELRYLKFLLLQLEN